MEAKIRKIQELKKEKNAGDTNISEKTFSTLIVAA